MGTVIHCPDGLGVTTVIKMGWDEVTVHPVGLDVLVMLRGAFLKKGRNKGRVNPYARASPE